MDKMLQILRKLFKIMLYAVGIFFLAAFIFMVVFSIWFSVTADQPILRPAP